MFSSWGQPSAAQDSQKLQLLPQAFERGPARVGILLAVRVRLHVQILAALRAEAGAVGPAEDLRRQREQERVAGPGREVEPVVDEVRRRQLVGVGARRLVLAQG